ncbi:AAA family ATPase, partial [Candidatus Aerophobetes bacterium]|nr:AAA family ATPase [Candidatus Aerophobetes bacterium]
MKIAITGKGGVGKTTVAAGLVKYFSLKGKKVFAIDADPDTNLAQTLSFPNSSQITPLIQMKELIQERTGAKTNAPSPFFKLNPKVD